MPLVEKARIEIYIPDRHEAAYQNFLAAVEQEFTRKFGGCTTMRGVEGFYQPRAGSTERDPINLVYADTPFSFAGDRGELEQYADKLRESALQTLSEKAVLITITAIYHSESA